MEALLLWSQSQYAFADTNEVIRLLDGSVKEYHFRKNQILFTPDETHSALWFIARGMIKVYKEGDQAEQVIIDFCPENNFFFDLESYFFAQPADYYISALEDTRVLSVNYRTIRRLYDSDRNFRKLALPVKRQLVDRYHNRTNLLTMPTTQRFLTFCELFPYNRISRNHISLYLRIPYSSLNRIIHNSAKNKPL